MFLVLARKSLNVKIIDQGHQGQLSSALKMHCKALAANNSRRDHSVAVKGDGSAQRGCVRFMFGKTSLALFKYFLIMSLLLFLLFRTTD